LWSKTIGTESLIPCAAAGERVYIKSVNQLYALDRLTGETAWTYQGPGFVSMPAVAGGQIYIITRTGSSGQLRALRLADGQEIWQTDNARLANAAPVVAGGRVYVRTVDGSVLVYDQSRGKE